LRAFGGEWVPMATDIRNPLKLRSNARIFREMIQAERIDIVHPQSAGAVWSAILAADRMPVWLVTSFSDRLARPS
jgi:hypothetical protein